MMLQNMLAERFQIAERIVNRRKALVTRLVVAKGGSENEGVHRCSGECGRGRLRDRVHRCAPEWVPDGFSDTAETSPASGPGLWTTIGMRGIRLTGRQSPMRDLAHTLGAFMRQPVIRTRLG